eukprot:763627-Hanusia_phi.AAC.5
MGGGGRGGCKEAAERAWPGRRRAGALAGGRGCIIGLASSSNEGVRITLAPSRAQSELLRFNGPVSTVLSGMTSLGISWQPSRKQVIAPTAADSGYRHVLVVQKLLAGSPAAECGRIRAGDKLIAVRCACALVAET